MPLQTVVQFHAECLLELSKYQGQICSFLDGSAPVQPMHDVVQRSKVCCHNLVNSGPLHFHCNLFTRGQCCPMHLSQRSRGQWRGIEVEKGLAERNPKL